jgi:hypothetical protein
MCRFARGYADHTEHDYQALLAAVAQGDLHTEAANDRLPYRPNHSPGYEIARKRTLWPLPVPTATAQLSLASMTTPADGVLCHEPHHGDRDRLVAARPPIARIRVAARHDIERCNRAGGHCLCPLGVSWRLRCSSWWAAEGAWPRRSRLSGSGCGCASSNMCPIGAALAISAQPVRRCTGPSSKGDVTMAGDHRRRVLTHSRARLRVAAGNTPNRPVTRRLRDPRWAVCRWSRLPSTGLCCTVTADFAVIVIDSRSPPRSGVGPWPAPETRRRRTSSAVAVTSLSGHRTTCATPRCRPGCRTSALLRHGAGRPLNRTDSRSRTAVPGRSCRFRACAPERLRGSSYAPPRRCQRGQ